MLAVKKKINMLLNVQKIHKVRSTLTQSAVVGLLDRETKQVITFTVNSVHSKVLENLTTKNITLGGMIYSDEFKGYKGLKELYDHKIVRHRYLSFCK